MSSVSTSIPIEELSFYKSRTALIYPDPHNATARALSDDRTVQILRTRDILKDGLPVMRDQKASCLEPIEANGKITWKIADRQKWDNLTNSINDQEERIRKIEIAARSLDSLGGRTFLKELHRELNALGAEELNATTQLNTFAAKALYGSKLSPDITLAKNQIYQERKTAVDARIKAAKEKIPALKAQIEAIEAILSEAEA